MIAKEIDLQDLQRTFKLVNGVLWRKFRGLDWRPVNAKPNKLGYSQVGWNGKWYSYHRLVYVLSTGHDISENMQIDHIDGDPTNNRIENLRVVTIRENQQNRIEHRNGHLVGTCWNKRAKRWVAHIYIKGQNKHLGLFSTQEEAHEAYLEALNEIN